MTKYFVEQKWHLLTHSRENIYRHTVRLTFNWLVHITLLMFTSASLSSRMQTGNGKGKGKKTQIFSSSEHTYFYWCRSYEDWLGAFKPFSFSKVGKKRFPFLGSDFQAFVIFLCIVVFMYIGCTRKYTHVHTLTHRPLTSTSAIRSRDLSEQRVFSNLAEVTGKRMLWTSGAVSPNGHRLSGIDHVSKINTPLGKSQAGSGGFRKKNYVHIILGENRSSFLLHASFLQEWAAFGVLSACINLSLLLSRAPRCG